MELLSTLLVLFVAVERFHIARLEMTQIPSEKAAELSNMPYEFMEQKRVQTLFSSRDLYDGFLAIGLVWACFAAPSNAVYSTTILSLDFVLIAAAWGTFSSSGKGILSEQGLPTFLAAAAAITAWTHASHSFLLD